MRSLDDIRSWMVSRNEKDIENIITALGKNPSLLSNQSILASARSLEESISHVELLSRHLLSPDEQHVLQRVSGLFERLWRLENVAETTRSQELTNIRSELTPELLEAASSILKRVRDVSLSLKPSSHTIVGDRSSCNGVWELPTFILLRRISQILEGSRYSIVGSIAIQAYVALAHKGDVSNVAVSAGCREAHDIDLVLQNHGDVERLLNLLPGEVNSDTFIAEISLDREGDRRPLIRIVAYLPSSQKMIEQVIPLNCTWRWEDALGFSEDRFAHELATTRTARISLLGLHADLKLCAPEHIAFSKLLRSSPKDLHDIDVLLRTVHEVHWDEVWTDLPPKKRDDFISWIRTRQNS